MNCINYITFFLLSCHFFQFYGLSTGEQITVSVQDVKRTTHENVFWTYPFDTYLFAPGILCAEYLIGKYCPYYCASTGQIVIGNQQFHVINGYNACSCNFAEIILAEEERIKLAENSYSPKNWLEKSFYDLANFILLKRTLEPYAIEVIGESKTGFTLKPYFIDPYKINFGQDLDIKILSDQYDACCRSNLPESIILYGNSRGAATAFNFIATEYGKKIDKRIRAIILEGCFDAVRYVTWLHPLLRLLPKYAPMGISPIDDLIIKKFVEICSQNSIPVLCITSRADRIVPYANTKNLCMKLKEAGLKDFYLVELQRSGHIGYMLDDKKDTQFYLIVVHAFYKKYKCSHNAALAVEGAQELERCRVS